MTVAVCMVEGDSTRCEASIGFANPGTGLQSPGAWMGEPNVYMETKIPFARSLSLPILENT